MLRENESFLEKTGIHQHMEDTDITNIKRNAFGELYKKDIKERIIQSLNGKEKFLEHTLGSKIFDEIDEFFRIEEAAY